MSSSRIESCQLLAFPPISDKRGDIGVIEAMRDIPFDIKRIYYSYNTPNSVVRGGHAHKKLHQLIMAISGSFDVMLDDGHTKRGVTLNQRDQGLYICPLIWRDLANFSKEAVCLVLASDYYDEMDYIRDYKDFISFLSVC